MTKRRLLLSGDRHGHLTAVKELEPKNGRRMWLWRCDCGTEAVVRLSHVTGGKIVSCGCFSREHSRQRFLDRPEIGATGREAAREVNIIHGLSYHPLYQTWSGIRNRCLNRNDAEWDNYGGRGIQVHEDWRDDGVAFIRWVEANLGPRPKGCSIDRVDTDGNYAPGNLRWASPRQQANNTRHNRYITFNGETLTLIQWSRRTGIAKTTLWNRLYRLGWTVERSLTERQLEKLDEKQPA